jgi:hypothetical protein
VAPHGLERLTVDRDRSIRRGERHVDRSHETFDLTEEAPDVGDARLRKLGVAPALVERTLERSPGAHVLAERALADRDVEGGAGVGSELRRLLEGRQRRAPLRVLCERGALPKRVARLFGIRFVVRSRGRADCEDREHRSDDEPRLHRGPDYFCSTDTRRG